MIILRVRARAVEKSAAPARAHGIRELSPIVDVAARGVGGKLQRRRVRIVPFARQVNLIQYGS